jgi:hypothetical protein
MPWLLWALLSLPFSWIGHPITFLKWALEWAGRYCFGLSGMASVMRGLIECGHIRMSRMDRPGRRKLGGGGAPRGALRLGQRTVGVLALTFAAVAASWLGKLWGNLDGEAAVAAFWGGLFELVIPHCSAFASWLLVHLRLASAPPYLEEIRFIGKRFVVPCVLGALVAQKKSPF